MDKIKFLTLISIVLIIGSLFALYFGFHSELINNQKGFVVMSGVFLILFGFLLSIETKVKWLEYKNKSEKK
jgi:hypothetical protein